MNTTSTPSRGSRSVAETITITVSKEFANNARAVGFLLADEDLGKAIERTCGWCFDEFLGRGHYRQYGPAPESYVECRYWDSEAACRTAVERLLQKVHESHNLNPIAETEGRWTIEVGLKPEAMRRSAAGLAVTE